MKRITAIILLIGCVFALFSCSSPTTDAIERVAEIFESNAPTKIVIETKQAIGEDAAIELSGVITLVTGKYNGLQASVYTSEIERFATIDEGATEEKPYYIVSDVKKMEFLDGKGVRVDGGRWDPSADDFAPTVGDITLNITKDNATDAVYENGVLTFTVKAENTAEVLGEAYAQATDVYVEVTEYEGFITKLVLSYVEIPEDDDYPEETITITVNYSYGIQTVNID